jgi:hypothetical protein
VVKAYDNALSTKTSAGLREGDAQLGTFRPQEPDEVRHSFKWRNHQPDIGRFFNIDPLADKYVYNSPYAFSENQVVAFRELEGLEKVFS